MSEKTEKPTDKKKRDAAKKGNSLKSKDLTINVILFVTLFALSKIISFKSFISLYENALQNTNQFNIGSYVFDLIMIFFETCFPFVILSSLTGLFISMLQTRFVFSVEALKLNFSSLNPVEGVKKLFSLRTVKELVKSIFYLIIFSWIAYHVFYSQIKLTLSSLNGDVSSLIDIWVSVSLYAVLTFNLCCVFMVAFDFFMEFLLHNKDLKMEKHEVKQEHKENEGNPEIKGARRRMHSEILTGEEEAAVRNSEVVLANPTHIAIAVYFNPDVAPLPFVALRCTNQKAKAVIAYAEKIGIPVVRSIKLTRKIYKNNQQHTFIGISDDSLMEVMDILIWLKQVESLNTSPEPVENQDKDCKIDVESNSTEEHEDV